MFYSLFLYGVIDWIFDNILFRIGGGSQMCKRVCTQWGKGVVASVHVHMMTRDGVNVWPFWCIHAN